MYLLEIDVPYYDRRRVTITFENGSRVPKVTVDGPPESKHRYSDGSLCMWCPRDSVEKRWEFRDGLLQLLPLIGTHLFREAWWRETGDWPGEEAPHGDEKRREGE